METLSPPPGFGASLQQRSLQSQLDKVKRSKYRRVSWAIGDKFCQIRLFAAEDAPAMAGTVQEQLQAKPPRNFQIFLGQLVAQQAALAAFVPQIPWRSPSGVKLDPTWDMGAEASTETELQKLREVRVLEAVYPRPSSIPHSPAEPLEVQEPYDDAKTAQIPLVPLEEEDLPDRSDVSTGSRGPQVTSEGRSRRVAGMQMVSPKASVMPNSRSEKATLHCGQDLPVAMQEVTDSKGSSSMAFPALSKGRYSFVEESFHSPADLPSNIHINPNHSGVGPAVTVAALAASAAFSKSGEVGSMIDNELLIQILSNPALIHSLTSQLPFPIVNNKSEISSNAALGGLSSDVQKSIQAQVVNSTGSCKPWINPFSTSYTSDGQEGSRSRIVEAGNERLKRITTRSDDSSSNCPPVPRETDQRYMGSTIGSGLVPLQNGSSGPPDSGNDNTNANATTLPGFGYKSGSHQGSQIGAPLTRPFSRHDEQYYKSLIMQHGCKSADDDDHARAGPSNQANAAATPSNSYTTIEGKRWYGKEESDAARFVEDGRDLRDTGRNGMGSAQEHGSRSKSRKACIYFATSRGCRNGDNCMFVHEVRDSEKTRADRVRTVPTHLQYSKRLKVDG